MATEKGALDGVADEKAENAHASNVIAAAERGQAATDQYGRVLIEFDRAAERRLRLKIDLCIVPTVALLYLFCFIDRANIGRSPPLRADTRRKAILYYMLLV